MYSISPTPLKSSVYYDFLLNFSCDVMCLTIPPIKICLVGEIFGVKYNMWLSTGDVRDFHVICGF